MASITKDPNGRKRLPYIDGAGNHQKIHLGKMTVTAARWDEPKAGESIDVIDLQRPGG